jgi:transposase-like protein
VEENMGQVKQTKRKYTAEEKENAVNTAKELGNTIKEL